MTPERKAAMEYADRIVPVQDPHHDANHLCAQETFLAGIRWEREWRDFKDLCKRGEGE